MNKTMRALAIALLLGATASLIGCSSPPANDTKPVNAGNGPAGPAGASGAGNGGAAAAGAQQSGAASAK